MCHKTSGQNPWTPERTNVIRELTNYEWVKPGRAATALGVGRTTIHNYLRRGHLHWTPVGAGRNRLVRTSDLMVMIYYQITMGLTGEQQADYGITPELVEKIKSIAGL